MRLKQDMNKIDSSKQKGVFWLVTMPDESEPEWPPRLERLRIIMKQSTTLQECGFSHPYRASPIFPFRDNYIKPSSKSCSLYFYCFDNAFQVLGRLQAVGSDALTRRLWFTIGIASIVLITEDPKLSEELLKKAPTSPRSIEAWHVEKAIISNVECTHQSPQEYDPKLFQLDNYNMLPVTSRAIIDEFVSNIAIIVPKVSMHIPNELDTFKRLVIQINELIKEIVYLSNPVGNPPSTLDEYDKKELKEDLLLQEQILHQNLDRIIQVNSALSYVSTQALSGAVPILERRSLIRRYSLLGIGTAILALNRIARSIELAFSKNPIEDIIADRMKDAKPLPGLENLPEYDHSEWKTYSIDRWAKRIEPRDWYPKLPYYSGRLGFRETEYAISAAHQSLSGGASLEWSLLTATHEMLHGHVRNLLTLLFQGDKNKSPDKKRKEFYECYTTQVLKKGIKDENELGSIRKILLAYCCLTITHGSLTRKIPPNNLRASTLQPDEIEMEITRHFLLPKEEKLWYLFEQEYRNISEIFVHILDLHYFYASRIAVYLPMIWRSWAEVPHVKGDLRQYILRSLLIISAKVPGSPYERFNMSLKRLRELIEKNIKKTLDFPVIHKVKCYIEDKDFYEDLFYPFSASLILVDLVDNVFMSHQIRGELLSDPLVSWVSKEGDFEDRYEYRLPEGFVEESIERPAAFLLDRMIPLLQSKEFPNNLEAETAKLFLACCSNLDREGKKHGDP